MKVISPQSAAEIFAMATTNDRPPLFGDWLEPLMPSLIAGEPGSGKSWFIYWLAGGLANGIGVFNWAARAPLKVVIIDAEMRLGSIQKRLTIVEASLGQTEDRLKIVARHQFRGPRQTFPSLQDKADVTALLDSLSGVDVVFFDNVGALFPSGNENEPQYWIPVENVAWACQDRGITPFFVHHTPKSNRLSPAGSSKNRRIFETIIVLSKVEENCAGAHFNLHFDKLREMPLDATDRSAKLNVCPQTKVATWFINASQIGQLHSPTAYSDDVKAEVLRMVGEKIPYSKIQERTGVAPGTITSWKHSAFSAVIPYKLNE